MAINLLSGVFTDSSDFSTEEETIFESPSTLTMLINTFCDCGVHFNSAVNPFIYAYRIKDVRDAVKKLFKFNSDKADSSSYEMKDSSNISKFSTDPPTSQTLT